MLMPFTQVLPPRNQEPLVPWVGTPTVRDPTVPSPGPSSVKKSTIYPNDSVLHFLTNERISEIGRDRRSRPCAVRPAAPPRAAGTRPDARRPRRQGRAHSLGALADRERQARAAAVSRRAARRRARRARVRAAQEAAAEPPRPAGDRA